MLRKIYDNFEEYLAVFFCMVMTLCLALQVCIRTFSGSALAWTEELSRYCFIWAVYTGMCVATKKSAHVRISAQFLLVPIRIRLIFRFAADLLGILLNLAVVWICFATIADNFDYPEISPTLGIVKSYVEMVIPVCFILSSWRCVEIWLRHWRNHTLPELVSDYEEKGL